LSSDPNLNLATTDLNAFREEILDESEEIHEFQTKLRRAIIGFKKFYQTETPKFKIITELKDGNKIEKQVKETSLYPFKAENQNAVLFNDGAKSNETFNDYLLTIDQAMYAVLSVTMYARSLLYQLEKNPTNIQLQQSATQLGQLMPSTIYQVQPEQKQGLFSKLFGQKEDRENPNSPLAKTEKILQYLEFVYDTWGRIRGYHADAIDTSEVNWVTENTHMGAEGFRALILSVFSSYVEPKLMTIYQFNYTIVKEKTAKRVTDVTMAQMQLIEKHRNDMMNQPQPPQR
jgi:hypothetical protein